MRLISLQSGSNGNCTYVEAAGVRLLIDAGIPGKVAESRLAQRGKDIRHVDSLLLSHDHRDHTQCAGIIHRKFGIPICVTNGTWTTTRRRIDIGPVGEVTRFEPGNHLRFGDLVVETIPTPHDGVDGVAFVIDDGRRRLGILTDLGHVFDRLSDVIATLDAVFIEANYDAKMLANGPYSDRLQRRIRGEGGHLSNAESAELVSTCDESRLQWICLAHLSAENNCPNLAVETFRSVLGNRARLEVAGRHSATPWLEVE